MAKIERIRDKIDECLSEADNTAYEEFSRRYIKTRSPASTLITLRHKLAEWLTVLGTKDRWTKE